MVPRVLNNRHTTAARTGECRDDGLQFSVGRVDIAAFSRVQRLHFTLSAGRSLCVNHRVHQTQHVQQLSPALPGRSGQQFLRLRLDTGKNGIGAR